MITDQFHVQQVIGYRWKGPMKTFDIHIGEELVATVSRDGTILDLQLYVGGVINEWIEPANFELWLSQRPTTKKEIKDKLDYKLLSEDVDNDIHADKERIHG